LRRQLRWLWGGRCAAACSEPPQQEREGDAGCPARVGRRMAVNMRQPFRQCA